MKKKQKSIFKILWEGVIPISIVLIFLYNIMYHQISDYMISNYGAKIGGQIIEEKYIIGNSKVATKDSYNFGYEFSIDGETFTGNSHQNRLTVGTSIEIEYCKFYPTMNRMKRE